MLQKKIHICGKGKTLQKERSPQKLQNWSLYANACDATSKTFCENTINKKSNAMGGRVLVKDERFCRSKIAHNSKFTLTQICRLPSNQPRNYYR